MLVSGVATFIVDVMYTQLLTAVTLFVAVRGRCEDDWVSYNNFCYLHSQQRSYQTLTYTQARRQCQHLGADLVSIHSSHENTFLTSLVKANDQTDTWIGITNRWPSDTHSWSDGTPTTFTSWPDTSTSWPDDRKERRENDRRSVRGGNTEQQLSITDVFVA